MAQVKSPSVSLLPQSAVIPAVSPVVVVFANEEKKPACTETGARSLVSMLRKAPTVQVSPMVLVVEYVAVVPAPAYLCKID